MIARKPQAGSQRLYARHHRGYLVCCGTGPGPPQCRRPSSWSRRPRSSAGPPALGVLRGGDRRAAQQLEQRPQQRRPEPLPAPVPVLTECLTRLDPAAVDHYAPRAEHPARRLGGVVQDRFRTSTPPGWVGWPYPWSLFEISCAWMCRAHTTPADVTGDAAFSPSAAHCGPAATSVAVRQSRPLREHGVPQRPGMYGSRVGSAVTVRRPR